MQRALTTMPPECEPIRVDLGGDWYATWSRTDEGGETCLLYRGYVVAFVVAPEDHGPEFPHYLAGRAANLLREVADRLDERGVSMQRQALREAMARKAAK